MAVVALVFQFWIIVSNWSELPARIPTHFGISGRPDHYGGKSTLVALGVMALLLYLFLTIISFFPQTFHYPVLVTAANRTRLQAIALAELSWVKAEMAWVFAYIFWTVVQVARGDSEGLGWTFAPMILVVVGTTIVTGIMLMHGAG